MDLGIRGEIEPIASIEGGSIAERAGFHVGDRIVKMNGQPDFDPFRLPDLCFAEAGKPVTFRRWRAPGAQAADAIVRDAFGHARCDPALDAAGRC